MDDDDFPLSFPTISNHQRDDTFIQASIIKSPNLFQKQVVHGVQLVFYRNKIIIPATLVKPIINWYHVNLNHPGSTRTFETINAHFTCKHLQKFVNQHVSQCIICNQQKTSTKKYGHLPPTNAIYAPWECVHIDLFGPWTFQCSNGIDHVLKAVSIIDNGLRWIELHEYSSKSSENIAFIFDREWLCRYPRPRMVVFDNGTEFTSEFFELLDSYGIQPKQTSIKNPQSNAIIERTHSTISSALRAMELNLRPCDDSSIHGILQAIAWGLRTTFHTSLKTSPAQLTFGQDMVIPATYLANWKFITTTRRNRIIYDNNRENKYRIDYDYKVGDYVFITSKDINRKLSTVKLGPFKIIQVHHNATVTIQRDSNVTERINIRRLHPAHIDSTGSL